MLMEVVSIIIPVFNMESSLAECLNSVLDQTYSALQILVVDDGSTDGSREVAEGYARQDERVVLISKENGGVSSARNRGLDEATGKYLMFVDADDRIEPGYVEAFVNTAVSNDVCLVIGGVTLLHGNERQVKNPSCGIYTQGAFFSYLCLEGTENVGFICGKIYERAIIEENRIRFKESMTSQEDLLFFLTVLSYIDSVYCFEEAGYLYSFHESGRNIPAEDLLNNQKKLYFDAERAGVTEPELRIHARRIQRALYTLLYGAKTEQEIRDYRLCVSGEGEERILKDDPRQSSEVRWVMLLLRQQSDRGLLRYFRIRQRIKRIVRPDEES